MATYRSPGVYVEEKASGTAPIVGVGTSTAGFIGIVQKDVLIPRPNPNHNPALDDPAIVAAPLTVDSLLGATLAQDVGSEMAQVKTNTLIGNAALTQQIIEHLQSSGASTVMVKSLPTISILPDDQEAAVEALVGAKLATDIRPPGESLLEAGTYISTDALAKQVFDAATARTVITVREEGEDENAGLTQVDVSTEEPATQLSNKVLAVDIRLPNGEYLAAGTKITPDVANKIVTAVMSSVSCDLVYDLEIGDLEGNLPLSLAADVRDANSNYITVETNEVTEQAGGTEVTEQTEGTEVTEQVEGIQEFGEGFPINSDNIKAVVSALESANITTIPVQKRVDLRKKEVNFLTGKSLVNDFVLPNGRKIAAETTLNSSQAEALINAAKQPLPVRLKDLPIEVEPKLEYLLGATLVEQINLKETYAAGTVLSEFKVKAVQAGEIQNVTIAVEVLTTELENLVADTMIKLSEDILDDESIAVTFGPNSTELRKNLQITRANRNSIKDALDAAQINSIRVNQKLTVNSASPEALTRGPLVEPVEGKIILQAERALDDEEICLSLIRNRKDEKVRISNRPYLLSRYTLLAKPGEVKLCTNFGEFKKYFGDFSDNEGQNLLAHAVYGFFNNGGTRCYVVWVTDKNGVEGVLKKFQAIDEIAIVAAPGQTDADVRTKLTTHCAQTMQDRFAIFDSEENIEPANLRMPPRSDYVAFYYPWIEVVDPASRIMNPRGDGDPRKAGRKFVPPSGHMAGIYARVDTTRGVHKAPANEVVRGALGLKHQISKVQQDGLNPQGVNVIRDINGNIQVWGARTLGGDANGEWKYINVRRLFLFLRESIDEGTQWAVFEPNTPALWAKIRRNITAFLTNVWRSGALFGDTQAEAFYVKCDAETNPPELRNLGQVVTEIGVAVVNPAEFVIFRISQWAGPGD